MMAFERLKKRWNKCIIPDIDYIKKVSKFKKNNLLSLYKFLKVFISVID